MSGPSRPRIAVIGAGPAGIMAALEAAAAGARVTLYDTNDAPGRKLLVTGNGRCNISHVGARAADYRCDQPQALQTILSRCGHTEVIARLADLGVLTYATPDGWCYPLSDSAVTVAEALTAALSLAGVELRLQTEVRDLRREPRVSLSSQGLPRPHSDMTGRWWPPAARRTRRWARRGSSTPSCSAKGTGFCRCTRRWCRSRPTCAV